jgi:hypothetical protein
MAGKDIHSTKKGSRPNGDSLFIVALC